MAEAVVPLAADFPAPDEGAWRALVTKTLGGAEVETLDHTATATADEPQYSESLWDCRAYQTWLCQSTEIENQRVITPAVGLALKLLNSSSTFCQASGFFLVANAFSGLA